MSRFFKYYVVSVLVMQGGLYAKEVVTPTPQTANPSEPMKVSANGNEENPGADVVELMNGMNSDAIQRSMKTESELENELTDLKKQEADLENKVYLLRVRMAALAEKIAKAQKDQATKRAQNAPTK